MRGSKNWLVLRWAKTKKHSFLLLSSFNHLMNNVRATYYCKWVVPQGAPAQLPVQVRSSPSVIYHLAGPPAPKWFRPSDWGRRDPPTLSLSLIMFPPSVDSAAGRRYHRQHGRHEPRAGACGGGHARSIRVEECCRGTCVDYSVLSTVGTLRVHPCQGN